MSINDATVVKYSENTYTVKTGDTLYSIAKFQLGRGTRYAELYKINKAAIDAQNKGKGVFKYTIYTGMKLKLPSV